MNRRPTWLPLLALLLMACPKASASPLWEGDLLARPRLDPGPSSLALAMPQAEEPSVDAGAFEGKGEAPRRWWAVLSSAAVPGLGETLTGHWRGPFMMALDAGFWYGVYDQNKSGNDWEDRYKAFADEHYSEAEWEFALQQGYLEPYFSQYELGSSKDDVALYVSKAEDEREWYENIGKWDVFAWGWDEYVENPSWPGDPASPDFDTPLRSEYISMRGESNDAFGRRDNFLNGALLLRVVSLVQMAYLEGFVGGRYDKPELGEAPAREGDAPQWSLLLEPRGRDETRLGVKVSY